MLADCIESERFGTMGEKIKDLDVVCNKLKIFLLNNLNKFCVKNKIKKIRKELKIF